MKPIRLSDSTIRVLNSRYLKRNKKGVITETFEQLMKRVAYHLSLPEKAKVRKHYEKEFFGLLLNMDFLPNSPTLMNAGTEMKLLSACFVLPVEDSMDGIFDSLKLMALIQQAGGGTGFSFSRLRPKGDDVSRGFGTAAGPVSFMRIFDTATENIRQGGRRRGANMGILRVDHPDVYDFIEAKSDGKSFQNFNLSIAITDTFMRALETGSDYALKDPRTGKTCGNLSAEEVFQKICKAAWTTGDPGIVFIDQINAKHPLPGKIEATNPCGEVPLLPFEACNLGSLNLSHFVNEANAEIDWKKMEVCIGTSVRLLDNVIDAQVWPSKEIANVVQGNRKIGLGVMGFADMLIQLGIPYNSQKSVATAESIMKFIQEKSFETSAELAKEKGAFPEFKKSIYAKGAKKVKIRNATRTSIAPTGTISIIAETSAGIEPLFALAYDRHVLDGQKLAELNPLFLAYLKKHGHDVQKVTQEVLKKGHLSDVQGIDAEAKDLFKTALELPVSAHMNIQAAFQKYTENAVSKTINLPEKSTSEEIYSIYKKAWKMKLKGITIYRYGSKDTQVLTLGSSEKLEEKEYFARCDANDCKL